MLRARGDANLAKNQERTQSVCMCVCGQVLLTLCYFIIIHSVFYLLKILKTNVTYRYCVFFQFTY